MIEEILLLIMALIMVGVMAKYERRFTRPENESTGEQIHWFKVAVNDKLVVPITTAIVGNAEALEKVFNYRMPERFVKDNLLGMVVGFAVEIPNGEWPYQKALITQQSLIYDLMDELSDAGCKVSDVSQHIGKGTKADPEVLYLLEQYVAEDKVTVEIGHESKAGSRTKYHAKGVSHTLD